VDGERTQPRSGLATVFSVSFGVGLIFGFQPPLMAFVLERDGASSFEIGAVTGISTIAVIMFGPLYPRLIGRLGLRGAVIAGIGLAALVLLAMPILHGIRAWFVLRFITGCAIGLAWIATEIWLNTASSDAARGKVMGVYATVFAAGVMAGPLLLQLTGTAGGQPFGIGAVVLAFTALPLLWLRHAPSVPRDAQRPSAWPAILGTVPVVMLAALIAGLVESADVSLLPVFGLRRGFDEHASLLLVSVFLAGNVFLQLPIGALADRFGRRPVLAGCALVSMIGPLLLPALMSIGWLLWPLLFAWGGMMYGFYTQGIALLGESYPAPQLAAANTVFVVVYCAGGVIGPTAGGLAMDLWRPNGLLVFLSAAALALLIGLAAEARSHRLSRT
jgi:MFS family permease